MNKLYQLLFLISLLSLVTVFSGCTGPETDFHSDYGYRIFIHTQYTPAHNVTLYLPLPNRNGVPQIGSLRLSPEVFGNETYTHAPLPPRSNYRFDITEVEGIPYLKIKAEIIQPDQEYIFDYEESVDTPPYTFLVNTRYPIGNESVFLPKYNVSEYSQFPSELNYTTSIFMDYDGPQVIFINEGLIGSNGWYKNFAWLFNKYEDGFALDYVGVSHGWQQVKGEMTVGWGIYLD